MNDYPLVKALVDGLTLLDEEVAREVEKPPPKDDQEASQEQPVVSPHSSQHRHAPARLSLNAPHLGHGFSS